MDKPIGMGVAPPQRCRSVRRSSPSPRTIGKPIGLGIAKKELTIDMTVGVAAIDVGEGSAPASHQIFDRGLMGLARRSEEGCVCCVINGLLDESAGPLLVTNR